MGGGAGARRTELLNQRISNDCNRFTIVMPSQFYLSSCDNGFDLDQQLRLHQLINADLGRGGWIHEFLRHFFLLKKDSLSPQQLQLQVFP
jgi:hypothetical protein